MPDFATRLAAALPDVPEKRRPIVLREIGEALSGLQIARSTVLRWQKGERAPDPWALALLAVFERKPELIEELRK